VDGAPRTRLYNFEERRRLAGRVAELDVEAISPNPYQPRTDFDESALEDLAASVRQLGIIQPLTVRALGDGRYELIAGERRLRASRRAGLKRVPAYVREADTEEMLEMAIVENVQREDLNPIEVALGYQRLMEEIGLTQEQVADKVGKNRSTVANLLRLLRLPPRVQASLREGTLSGGHARALVSIEDEQALLDLHRAILDDGLSVRDVERAAKRLREGDASSAPAPAPAEEPRLSDRDRLQIERFQDRLRDAVGSQVAIRHRAADGGGRIEIAYFSADDLERVMERLLGA
jgi:ParB family chromosome partitioning protein